VQRETPPRDDPGRGSEPRPEPDRQLARDLEVLRGGAPGAASRPRRRRVLPLLVVLGLLGLAAAFVAARVWLRPAEVGLVPVTRRDVGVPPVVITASGYVEAKRQITLSSKAQGKIVEMPVEENDVVKAGDLIARLENDEQLASLELARAEYADAQRELRRAGRLRDERAISEATLDAARTANDVAAARLRLSQVAVDNTTLRAPIDGTVIRKIRDVGEFLTIGVTAEGDPGTAVVTLADLSALDVSLEISEAEIRKVRLGAPVLVTPEAVPDRHYMADVSEIAAMADRQKGVVPVKVRIRAPDRELLPDMTAKVRFLEAEPEAPVEVADALPASAVVQRDGEAVVFVASDDAVEAVPVRTRPLDDETVVLVAPPPRLASGDAIRVATP
jgi:RND family efflux transporter MFP subunit